MKTIRKYCLDCANNQPKEVKLCPMVECPLYYFRLGKNPNIKRKPLTEEERLILSNRLEKSRKSLATQAKTDTE
jgi:hypothetical protein